MAELMHYDTLEIRRTHRQCGHFTSASPEVARIIHDENRKMILRDLLPADPMDQPLITANLPRPARDSGVEESSPEHTRRRVVDPTVRRSYVYAEDVDERP